jgi:hypothetical protein
MKENEIIKECKYHGDSVHVIEPNGRKRCKQCRTEGTQRRRLKLKLMAIEYKGGKCSKCGYNKCVDVLHFHHRNPNEKEFSISGKGITRSWEKVKKELDKCDLLCSNCHGELHFIENKTANKIEIGGLKQIIKCKYCKQTFNPSNGSHTYCSKECRLTAYSKKK